MEKHRKRLVREAEKHVDATHERVLRLLNELRQARQELADLRAVAVWASTYPDPAAAQEPPTQLVAGGLRKPVEQHLGINPHVQVHRLLDLLTDDTEWLKTAATPDQKKLITGVTDTSANVHEQAVWQDTDEGRRAMQDDLTRRRQRYESEWGQPAPW